jgi:cAMP-dependent protein kinase regulator
MAEAGAIPGMPRIPLFWLLSEDRLRSVLERCGRLEVPAGEVIVRQGEQVDNVYVILRGGVDVSVRSPRGEEPLGRRGVGEFFGELPLLVQQRQPATVTAAAPTALLRLDRALMEELLAEALPMRQMLLRAARDRAIERLVATSPLFDTLGVADAAALVGHFEFREFAPGTPLIAQGEAVATLLVVLAGGCDVVFQAGGAERPVALLGPGDLVGAVSLLERKPADVTVRTRTRVWALAMSPATFREVIVTYPTVLIHVSEVAQQRHARLAQLRG